MKVSLQNLGTDCRSNNGKNYKRNKANQYKLYREIEDSKLLFLTLFKNSVGS